AVGDDVGAATALLARGALSGRRGAEDSASALREAAVAYERLGFPLVAAHAYHLAGDFGEARTLYLACGAVGYATEEPATSIVAANWPLSGREESVAELVTLGLTNVAIAERLSISPKTVEKYLASIFRKLGLRSRSQIVARFVDRRTRHAAH
ncbi:MAG: helix-turn-helix transcriptional regulator, partial [Candidatus Eremiobacteraeota bacterium]|nr:helix-turn-helix transcriptional regulator [Candidatus Eremiobacteraeota bacterium]